MPPPLLLRVLGPVVAISTISVLGTGIALLLLGPDHRSPWLQIHKASFIIWFVATTVHVLGHIVETVRIAPRDWIRRGPQLAGTGVRRAAVGCALVAGLVLAVVVEPSVTSWLTAGASPK